MCDECLEVLQVVQAVEGAIKRRPEPQRVAVTYFSEHDTWLFQEVIDARLCPECRAYAERNGGSYTGLHLRGTFPYLMIQDLNMIKVNVHPNCRCYLAREIEPEVIPEVPKIDVDLMNRAKDEFHTTTDFREAGWLLPDGSMLDFSDRPYGGRGGRRLLDHSDIGRIAPDDVSKYAGTSHYPALRWFEQKGAMRFGVYNDFQDVIVSIDVKGDYQQEQWDKLRQAVQIAEDSFAYDLYDGGTLLDSQFIEDAHPSDVDNLKSKYEGFKRQKKIKHPEREPVPTT